MQQFVESHLTTHVTPVLITELSFEYSTGQCPEIAAITYSAYVISYLFYVGHLLGYVMRRIILTMLFVVGGIIKKI